MALILEVGIPFLGLPALAKFVSLEWDVGIGTQKIQEPAGTCLFPELAQLAVDMEVFYEVLVNERIRPGPCCCVSINPLRRDFVL